MQVDDANSMKGRKMKGDEQFIFLGGGEGGGRGLGGNIM